MASKSWHLYGDCDFFIVTWDIAVPSLNYRSITDSHRLTDLREFPVSYKTAIVSNLKHYLTILDEKKITHPHNVNISCMFYNWSLVCNLPNISSYDKIVITRTDLFPRYSFDKLYQMFSMRRSETKMLVDEYQPGGAIAGAIIIVSSDGLQLLKDIYDRYIQNPFNVHTFLRYFTLDDKYSKHIEKFNCTELGLLLMVRPGYSPSLLSLPYGPELYDRISEHSILNRITLDERLKKIKKDHLKNLAANFKR